MLRHRVVGYGLAKLGGGFLILFFFKEVEAGVAVAGGLVEGLDVYG
jgi:hypothetical protein